MPKAKAKASEEKTERIPVTQKEIAVLRQQLESLVDENRSLRKKLGIVDDVTDVKPLTDEEVASAAKRAGVILEQRNINVETAKKFKKQGRFDEGDELVEKARSLEAEALPHCAEAAGVKPEEIFHRTVVKGDGSEEFEDYGINVRRGVLRVVLTNGSRLKVDVRDPKRARWDGVHDVAEYTGRLKSNFVPDRWKGREHRAAMI